MSGSGGGSGGGGKEQAGADPWRDKEDKQCFARRRRKGMCHWMGIGRLWSSPDG